MVLQVQTNQQTENSAVKKYSWDITWLVIRNRTPSGKYLLKETLVFSLLKPNRSFGSLVITVKQKMASVSWQSLNYSPFSYWYSALWSIHENKNLSKTKLNHNKTTSVAHVNARAVTPPAFSLAHEVLWHLYGTSALISHWVKSELHSYQIEVWWITLIIAGFYCALALLWAFHVVHFGSLRY